MPAEPAPIPPIAKRVERVETLHGERRVDPYAWLRERDNPEVTAYLEAENAYTEAMTAHTKDLRESLYQEMLARIKEDDSTAPVRRGPWFYYSRTEQGKQYPIYCRKAGSTDAPEQVILDQNKLAEGEKFMNVGSMHVSDDGKLLAYTTDNTGFRQYALQIKNLETGELYPEKMLKVGSVAWASDNKTIFYSVEEEQTKRQYRVYRHTLGTPVAGDAVAYEDSDERFNVHVARTRSHDYLIIDSGSHTTSESRYLRADQTGDWTIIAPRIQDQEYEVDQHGDQFLIRTNDKGRNFRLVSAPVTNPGRDNWKELIPHRADVMLAGVDVFQDFYVVEEREKGLPQLRIIDFGNGASHMVEFPEPTYSAFPAQNREYKTNKYRYSYQSLVTPSSVYDYDVNTRKSELLKRVEVPGYDHTQYKSERLWATTKDGTKIPISIVYKNDFKKDGSHPMLLNAYGSYGFSYPVTFSASSLVLLDRGFSVAIAHIRGGGDMGKPWHDAGRMMNKKNTFTDFIDSAEYLVAQKYTTKDKLVITGASAGGLLMGAVTNMRPDLFKAVVTKVPFVDVINTMLDASLPLTVPEYEEWGNPNQKPAFDYMYSYSPYDNLAAKNYPSMLVKTSFNDSQVMYWEPAKYVAKLRTLKTDQNPLILKTNMAAGHGGASGRYDFLHDTAFDYAFMLWQVGLTK